MNINKSLFLFGGLLMLVLTSCEKVTEQINPSGITATNFYKTASDADVAINSCYDAYQNPDRYIMWGDSRTDLFAATDRSGTGDLQLVNGNVNAFNGYVSWDQMYNVIKRTNSVLKNVPTIADPNLDNRRERILGEAYFLRAMAYFYLVRTFDNVPLILEPYESLKQDFFPKQAAPEAVFAQVESDLLAAQERLTDRPFSTDREFKGKASLGGVRAALTDLYLWQKKYSQAASTAQLIINSPANYSLVSGANFGNIFYNRNTSESIWEIQFDNTLLEGNNNNLVNLFLPLGSGGYAGGNWQFRPSNKIINAYATDDLRGPVTVRTTGAVGAPFRDPNVLYINKYQGTLGNQNLVRFFDANQVIYRLADVILMRAEALAKLGQTEDARAELNKIRRRAIGVDPNTVSANDFPNVADIAQGNDLILAIENERFKELAFEGKRYYDLKRTGRYAAVTGNTNPDWLRWPINADEVTRNPNIIQNNGY